jgi:hypothetical protein
VQRDYLFGWIISGIFRESSLADWATLKGGNALRKGYMPGTRFSDDLDFSTRDGLDAQAVLAQLDERRTLIREVIRDVLPKGLPVTETVNLSTDEDLAAFVARLLDPDPETREELRAGRRRFRLGVPQNPQGPQAPQAPPVTLPASIPEPGRIDEEAVMTEVLTAIAGREH